MASLKLIVTTAKTAETLTRDYERPVSAKYPCVQSIAQLIESIVSGNQAQPSVASSVVEDATRASGTFIGTAVIATDAVSINGVTFTAVASGATGNQFNIGVSDTLTMANLAAAINASVTALVAGYVTASASGTTVTVYSTDYGVQGNQTLIASADSTIVASGARLTGGAVDPNAKLYTF